jgi:hypothetical protein
VLWCWAKVWRRCAALRENTHRNMRKQKIQRPTAI